jgi:hypothetical protein
MHAWHTIIFCAILLVPPANLGFFLSSSIDLILFLLFGRQKGRRERKRMPSMSVIVTALLIALLGGGSDVAAQTRCRGILKKGHGSSLWYDNFPIGRTDQPAPLCDGTVDVQQDGSICVTGRVTYEQLSEAVGKPIRAPASTSITITGHMVSGSANVGLGTEWGFLYDYITSYTVEGKEYVAASNNETSIVDDLLAASRGIIEKVCLSADFARDPAWYRVSHRSWRVGNLDAVEVEKANIVYFSRYTAVAEYFSGAEPPSVLSANALMRFLTSLGGFVPGAALRILPLTGATGIFRAAINGPVSTDRHPQPLTSPDTAVEDIQIDTEWDTFVAALEEGLFTTNKLPLYFGAFVRKLTPLGSDPNGCWKVPVAAIDVQAPLGRAAELDEFVASTVYPALSKLGTVSLHLGKRLPEGSEILQSALNFYQSCGAELDVAPAKCYHPVCKRTTAVDAFEYPPGLYAE